MAKFDQVIFLHFGQAGIQLGNSIWELFCIEHEISPDGSPLDPDSIYSEENNIFSLFDVGNTGKYIPRTIFIDSEPTIIDEIKTGAYRQLFNKKRLISDTEDAANNYARGSYTVGKKLIKKVGSHLRKLIEQTESLRGFFVSGSSGGGTGSGLTPLVFLSLTRNYPKITRTNFSIVPASNYSSAVVEPYNMSLQNFAIAQTTDINFLFENQSLYNVCKQNLFINSPTFTEINRLFAFVFSCLSCSLRYTSILRSAVDDFITNLVPYPRIHYPVVRYAPINHISRSSYQKLTTFELTRELFSKQTQSLQIDLSKGLYIAMVLNYQGLVQYKDIYKYIDEVRSQRGNQFVEWSPNGYKVGICKQVPSVIPMSDIAPSDQYATMLLNSTAIGEFFKSLTNKFDLLFQRRSFVHWYLGEGMEEIEFTESRNELELLIGDLREISMSEKEIERYASSEEKSLSRLCSFRTE